MFQPRCARPPNVHARSPRNARFCAVAAENLELVAASIEGCCPLKSSGRTIEVEGGVEVSTGVAAESAIGVEFRVGVVDGSGFAAAGSLTMLVAGIGEGLCVAADGDCLSAVEVDGASLSTQPENSLPPIVKVVKMNSVSCRHGALFVLVFKII